MQFDDRNYQIARRDIEVDGAIVTRATVNRNGYVFYVSNASRGEITVKNANNQEPSTMIETGDPIFDIRVTDDGKKLIVTGNFCGSKVLILEGDGQPSKFDARVNKTIEYNNTDYCTFISRDCRFLVYHQGQLNLLDYGMYDLHENPGIKIVDLETLEFSQQFCSRIKSNCIAISNNNERIATGRDNSGLEVDFESNIAVTIREISTGNHLCTRKFSEGIYGLTATREPNEFAMVLGFSCLYTWDTNSNTIHPLMKLRGDFYRPHNFFTLSSDKTMVAYPCGKNSVILQDIRGNYICIPYESLSPESFVKPIVRFSMDETKLFICNHNMVTVHETKFAPFWSIQKHASFEKIDRDAIRLIYLSHQIFWLRFERAKLQHRGRGTAKQLAYQTGHGFILPRLPIEIVLIIFSFIQRTL